METMHSFLNDLYSGDFGKIDIIKIDEGIHEQIRFKGSKGSGILICFDKGELPPMIRGVRYWPLVINNTTYTFEVIYVDEDFVVFKTSEFLKYRLTAYETHSVFAIVRVCTH